MVNKWYSQIALNIGNGLSSDGSQFVAPQDGTYFFGFSSGITSGNSYGSTLVVLSVNSVVDVCGLMIGDQIRAGSDAVIMGSRTCLFPMNTGDIVTFNIKYSYDRPIYSSDSQLTTTLNGFLYTPISGIQVSWVFSYTAVSLFVHSFVSSFISMLVCLSGLYYLMLSLIWTVEIKYTYWK